MRRKFELLRKIYSTKSPNPEGALRLSIFTSLDYLYGKPLEFLILDFVKINETSFHSIRRLTNMIPHDKEEPVSESEDCALIDITYQDELTDIIHKYNNSVNLSIEKYRASFSLKF